jgi:hypothetical protein
VTVRVAQEFVARLAVDADAQLVAHRAGGDEQGGLLAEEGGRFFLEPIDRGVFAVDVVADLGRGHGGAHAGRGAGERVAAEVDHGGRLEA